MEKKQTLVRMPVITHKWIVQSAAKNNRSMNGEIVRMLNEVIEREREEEETEEKAA